MAPSLFWFLRPVHRPSLFRRPGCSIVLRLRFDDRMMKISPAGRRLDRETAAGLEHFQPDRNRPGEAGGPRLIQMLYKQQAGAAGRMSTIFQTG
jgi:hypothetical protein